jgi:aromatic-L-amino-acid decarboxylase
VEQQRTTRADAPSRPVDAPGSPGEAPRDTAASAHAGLALDPAGLALDPAGPELAALLGDASRLVTDLLQGFATRDPLGHEDGLALVPELLADRPGSPVPVEEALATVGEVVRTGLDNATGGELGYIPGSGLVTAAVAELLAATANRYTGLPGQSPAAVALEEGVLRWLTELFALPASAQAVLLSGGSAANLTALVAAREKRAPGQAHLACVYVGEHAHASVRKAARIAGLDPAHVRVCASSDGLRLDVEAVRVAIKQDLADGLLPIALVGAAGTTNAGSIDPLPQLAALARDLGVWFHVDGAYGGFFQLTDRGRQRLSGIELADSITLDPHKSLFLPFGTGALLVRDRADLKRAFAERADYLRDQDEVDGVPDLSSMTPELTRDWRGLKLWLPLKLHGVDAFVTALDDKLDAVAAAWRELAADPNIEVVGRPDLSIVTFRVRGDDAAQERLLAEVHRDGRVRLSSTVIDGRVTVRIAVLSHRTDRARVDHAVRLVRDAAAVVTAG